jgi:hypothetical protein
VIYNHLKHILCKQNPEGYMRILIRFKYTVTACLSVLIQRKIKNCVIHVLYKFRGTIDDTEYENKISEH